MATGSMRRKVFTATLVDTPTPATLRIRHERALGVDESGRIAFIESIDDHDHVQRAVEKHGWAEDSYTLVDLSSTKSKTRFLIPGFIDTHTHASQYPNTGIFGSSTLLSWLETYTFPLESSFSSLDRARRVYDRVVSRTLSHGTTCAAYYATIHVPATNLLADICAAKGQRALIGRVCMDRMSPEDYQDESAETAISKTKEVMAHLSKIDPTEELLRPVITPRFAPSCTSDCMHALADLHEETDAFIQTHISENSAEIQTVKELFPDCDHYTGVYDTHGLLTRKTILAHAIHLSPEEVSLISQRNSKVSHCPASNSCLTSGAAGVRYLLDAGVSVGLGTDMSGGYSPSILEMARQAVLVSNHVAFSKPDGDHCKVSFEEGLWLATRGGAEVVGLDDVVGAFEVGMDFDAQFIKLGVVPNQPTIDIERGHNGPVIDSSIGPVDLYGWESWEDLVAKWFFTGDDRNVQAVWVKGRPVHVLEDMWELV